MTRQATKAQIQEGKGGHDNEEKGREKGIRK